MFFYSDLLNWYLFVYGQLEKIETITWKMSVDLINVLERESINIFEQGESINIDSMIEVVKW
jgi:hypothetical protein